MAIVIPEARAHSRAWHDATELAERFPSIEPAAIETILIEARRNVDLFGLEREEERVAMTERIAVAVLEAAKR
jgi:hypothetical protein